MAYEVRIPTLGESITEGVILGWRKKDGEKVGPDDVLLELETDKASVEIPAGASGVVRVLKKEGDTVQVGDVVARIEEGAGAPASKPATKVVAAPPQPAPPPARPTPIAPPAPSGGSARDSSPEEGEGARPRGVGPLSPAVRRLIDEHRLDASAIRASGRGGRLTKEDVLAHIEQQSVPEPRTATALKSVPSPQVPVPVGEGEKLVPMTPIRRRIAERLVRAQHTAAILTTFNEIDMSAVMALRAQHKERFQQLHGVGLGFMSFFARACVTALREVPGVNAEIRGDSVVYRDYVHMGIAVGTPRGLVVPVIRHAERLGFADIEREIGRLAGLARDGKLSIDDLTGGTFTISNGGIYGSLLSTPILNPPQSGILGMHKIEKRAVVVNDQIAIRPMMYVALSYDHRLVDGEQAVTFLVHVKERVEEPTRLLLDV
jgi:2-oxoglutarate dehydrogenase E2 component (dihydrolipoamide succinyltransferase)